MLNATLLGDIPPGVDVNHYINTIMLEDMWPDGFWLPKGYDGPTKYKRFLECPNFHFATNGTGRKLFALNNQVYWIAVTMGPGTAGYLRVTFPYGSHSANWCVCSCFHEKPHTFGDVYTAGHILNNDKTDNRAVNLDWRGKKEQAQDKEMHGSLCKHPVILTTQQVFQVSMLCLGGYSSDSISDMFGMSRRAIQYFKVGDAKKHKKLTGASDIHRLQPGFDLTMMSYFLLDQCPRPRLVEIRICPSYNHKHFLATECVNQHGKTPKNAIPPLAVSDLSQWLPNIDLAMAKHGYRIPINLYSPAGILTNMKGGAA